MSRRLNLQINKVEDVIRLCNKISKLHSEYVVTDGIIEINPNSIMSWFILDFEHPIVLVPKSEILEDDAKVLQEIEQVYA